MKIDRIEGVRSRCWMAFGLASLFLWAGSASAADYETAQTRRASDLLPAEAVQGEHHTVAEEVRLDGVMHFYQITSDYGDFDAYGDMLFQARLGEIEALNELAAVSKAEVFTDSAIQAVLRPVNVVSSFAEKPVETIKGIPDGVGRMFGRMKRGAKDAKESYDEYKEEKAAEKSGEVDETETSETKAGKKEKATSLANKAFGVTGAYRKWAQKLGVDPYTDNETLQKALTEVARYDAAGSVGVKVVGVPKVPGVKYIADVNQLVWSKDPGELAAFNEERMLAMGVTEEQIERFRANPFFASPTRRTRLVAAAAGLEGVENQELLIEMGADAASTEESIFQTTSAMLLQWFHGNQTPLTRLVQAKSLGVGVTGDDRMILALAADRLLWTETVAGAIDWFDGFADSEGAKRSELWMTGTVSSRCQEELEARGWAVHGDLRMEAGR